MGLLHYCTLEPSAEGGLAAIRFSAAVRVHTIRIFPTDCKPFVKCPDVVSRTEPQEFFLQVYFNAHPVANPNATEKPKPSNVLVPTSLAYTGGQRDFVVNMGPESATRLMIIKGAFESISMAIYGEVASELPAAPKTYEPRPLPSLSSSPLPPALDPANSRDPTQLARKLLKLIPDAPDLELAIRLLFCLKPHNDEWDLPEFPHIHSDLDEDVPEFDLEKALDMTKRPVSDDISSEVVSRFAEKVAGCINDQDTSQAFLVAGLICNSASQHPALATSLLDAIDLRAIFGRSALEDEMTLKKLLYAAANPDISRRLNADWFHELLRVVSVDPNNERKLRKDAKKLSTRICGWTTLEDTFSNTQGDFIAAAGLMKDIGTEEQSFGIWLESMVSHQDLVAGLAENPVVPVTLPRLFSSRAPGNPPSQDEFIAFTRAFIGVASVLAVYSWSDSLPDPPCRSRIFGILRFWQNAEGYREILNHLLMLRQMAFRLECMINCDPPDQAAIDTEHILVDLAREPSNFLISNFTNCIMKVKKPTTFITEEERKALYHAADLAQDEFYAVAAKLSEPIQRPPTYESLRLLRVSLAYMSWELDEDDESEVLDQFWDEAGCSFVTILCDLLGPIAEEIRTRFSIRHPPPPRQQEVLAQLFATADDLQRLLLRLVPNHPLPSRLLRTLTTDAADVFACTDAAEMQYSQSPLVVLASQEARRTCIDLVRGLAEQHAGSSDAKPSAQTVLRVLLHHGLHSDLDPTHRLIQVFWLLNYVLPPQECTDPQRTFWVQRVIPSLLHELSSFCRTLDTENKVYFFKRLADLDQGVIGIGEWLLMEEIKDISTAVQALADDSLSEPRSLVIQAQVSLFFRFLRDLMQASSTAWVLDGLTSSEDAHHLLATSLIAILELALTPPHVGEIAEELSSGYEGFDNPMRLAIVLCLWRSLQTSTADPSALERCLGTSITIIKTITPSYMNPFIVTGEIGRLLLHLAENPVSVDDVTADSLVSLLEWMAGTSNTIPRMAELRTVPSDTFISFRETLNAALPPEFTERLDTVSRRLVFASGDVKPALPSTVLPDAVALSMHALDGLLRQATPAPTTPPSARRALNQDVFALVTVSPPTLLRSPAATGLTKTYLNNDFRQLRQASARANTSRLPSMHVDVGVALAA
ncbi:uncharacterized protein BXZ73DRAFT_49012 [Epithele typhae]|uniref:uncharacterized protein n=1 Tax=Epithele typhae TaxID=378194 RepID=UPI0020074131|nr:uncharacterized protein BXZ73DRAFT_49012 [Epithele typhae]KAH9927088.1 hypothetical protein BXZ73DRAFT_49012 [Epithele typhae]